jgi:hypothetical protein
MIEKFTELGGGRAAHPEHDPERPPEGCDGGALNGQLLEPVGRQAAVLLQEAIQLRIIRCF